MRGEVIAMGRKIIFFDIDGTLTKCEKNIHKPTPETIRAIRKLKENRIYVAIATGRSKCFIQKSILELEPDILICNNGAYIEMNGEVINSKPISKTYVVDIVNTGKIYEIPIVLESPECCYAVNMSLEERKRLIRNIAVESRFIKTVDEQKSFLEQFQIYKLIVILPTKEKFDIINRKYGNEFNILRQQSFYSYDFYPKNVSKGKGVRIIKEYVGNKLTESYAFGDDVNDMEMLNEADIGIAMGDGNEELKKHADYVTEPLEQEGISKMLTRLELI
ncbi:Cof-type HAD-IIB family hydrolase [Acidilutibacter cellobiosedens]|jgi:hypothetical protein|uniref:Cof-type HAD-IIB family hydrolase n=2 Tax=Tissierellia TaxID=1737404 RepID=A0A410QFP7_9FIRM|nr:Cof-type HAD-IIB family hydrolase [Acidilutibacter cellobiosedens]